MALKNINEINTGNYSEIDQNFTTYTLGSLANMGQRFSADGSSLSQTYFTVSDIIPGLTDNISYIRCNITETEINVYIENSTSEPIIIDRDQVYKDTDTGTEYEYIKEDNEFWYKYKDSENAEPLFNDDIPENAVITESYTYCIYRINNIDRYTRYFFPVVYYKTIKYKYDNNLSNGDNDSILIYKYEYDTVNGKQPVYKLYYHYCTDKAIKGKVISDYENMPFTPKAGIYYDIITDSSGIITGISLQHNDDNNDNGSSKSINTDNYIWSEINGKSPFDSLDNIISIYNKEYTNSVKLNIFKELLYSLLESYNTELGYYSPVSTLLTEPLDIYISTDYRFSFYCDSVEQTKLYHNVNDVIVKECINLENNDISEYVRANHNNIICDWSKVFGDKSSINIYDIYDKYVLYNINIRYDNITETEVSDYYTLPYINKYNHWVINNTESKISAAGLASETGFIIINSNNVLQDSTDILQTTAMNPECLSSMYADDINNLIGFDMTGYKIVVSDYSSYNKESEPVTVGCALPDIGNINDSRINLNAVNFIKASVIMVISEFKKNSNTFYVVSYWVWDKDTKDFKVISDESGKPLDLYTLANIYETIQVNLKSFIEHPGQYLHQQLIFKQILNGYNQAKNNPVYPGIQNITYIESDKDNNIYGIKQLSYNNGDDRYRNTANLVVGFWNRLEQSKEGTGKYQDSSLRFDVSDTLGYIGLLFDTDADKLIRISQNTYINKDNKQVILNDFIPDVNSETSQAVPMIDMSSVFIRHINTLNRNNIISIGEDRSVYYSYIGTDFTSDKEKHILKLGSYNTSVDLSEMALNHKDNGKFRIQDTVQFDFDKFNISGTEINFTNDDTVNLNYKNLALHGSSIDMSDNGSLMSVINSQLVYKAEKSEDNIYIVPLYPVINKDNTDILSETIRTMNTTSWLYTPADITDYIFNLKKYIDTLELPESIVFKYYDSSTAFDYSTIRPLSADIIKLSKDYRIVQPINLLCNIIHTEKMATSELQTIYNIKNVILGFNNRNYI